MIYGSLQFYLILFERTESFSIKLFKRHTALKLITGIPELILKLTRWMILLNTCTGRLSCV